MATLTSTKIKNTYDALLKASDNDSIGSSAKQITDGLGNGTPLYISTTQIGIGVTPEATYDLHVYSNAKVGGNLTVTGDLTVEGTTTTIDTQTLTVEDPLIEVASNNTSTDAVDIGWYGKYAPSGTTLYAGLFRDTGDGKFKLFKSLEEAPTTTVNTSGTGYARADLIIGNLEATQIDLGDDEKIRLGNSQDLEIYHNSATNQSFIRINGELELRANTLQLKNYAGETYLRASSNGAVRLYYDGSEKLETTSTGVSVTGDVVSSAIVQAKGFRTETGSTDYSLLTRNSTNTAVYIQQAGTGNILDVRYGSQAAGQGTSAMSVSSSGNTTFTGNIDINGNNKHIRFIDTYGNWKIEVGDGANNFKIHSQSLGADYLTIDGSGNTTIAGNLTVSGTGQSSFGGQVTVPATPSASTDAASKGYVDSQVGANNELSEVLANGNTTGGTDISVSAGDDITFTDTSKAIFGTGTGDLQIYHNGNSIIDNNTNDLIIRCDSDDIKILAEDDILLRDNDDSTNFIHCVNGGSVKLYHNGSEKLQTTSSGVTITGDGTFSGSVSMNDLKIFDSNGSSTNRLKASYNGTSGVALFGVDSSGGNTELQIGTSNSGTYTTAITINSSQNTTFAGNITFGATNPFQQSTNVLDGTGTDGARIRSAVSSATNPTFSNSDDTNTGMFFAGADTLGFSTSGSERMRIDNVGVITMSSQNNTSSQRTSKFDSLIIKTNYNGGDGQPYDGFGGGLVFNNETYSGTFYDSAAIYGGIGDDSVSTTVGGHLAFYTSSTKTAAPTEKMLIDSNGVLQLTESSASAFLNANGTSLELDINRNPETGTFGDTNKSHARINLTGANGGSYIIFNTASANNTTASERMRINSTGLGIGTDSPSYLLHLEDSNGADLALSNSSSLSNGDYVGRIYGLDSSNNFFTGINMFYHDSNDGEIRFRIKTAGTNTDVMTLVDGNCGIGTTAPNRDLHVIGQLAIDNSTNPSAGLLIFGDSTSNKIYSRTANNSSSARHLDFISGSSTSMRIHDSARVGIGTTSPAYKLDVNGTFRVTYDALFQGGEEAIKIIGSSSQSMLIGSTGTGFAGIYMDASNGDFAGSDYVFIGQDNDKTFRLEAYTNAGDLLFRESGTDTLRLSGGNATFAGNATIETGINLESGVLVIKNATSDSNGLRIFQDSSDTSKIYNNYNGTLQLGVGNTTALTINSSERIGIGDTSPSYRLDVNETGTSTYVIHAQKSGTSLGGLYVDGGSNAEFYLKASGNSTKVLINSSGNSYLNGGSLGIGTSSPTNILHTYTSSNTVGRFESTDGVACIRINDTDDSLYIGTESQIGSIGGNLGANDNNLNINLTNGFVGIGKTSPSDALEIYGDTKGIIIQNTAETDAGIMMRDSADGGQQASIKYGSGDNALKFFNSTTERMRITSAGAVAIGVTSSAGSRMHVKAPSGTSDMIVVQTGSTANTNVGAIVFRDLTYGSCGQITVNGSTNTTAYNTSSDYRLKQDYQDFNGLDLVSDIPVYNFQWKKSGTRAYGVQAHELQEVLPEAVVGEKDGEEMQQVDYSKIVPILLKSIQELKAEIKTLKAQINN